MSELFSSTFVPDPAGAATDDAAWIQAMLDFEAALAAAESRAGLIPAEAAEAIRSACVAGRFDAAELGRQARSSGNPVVPLVKALMAEVGERAARHVHLGATSQDVLDTATMLVARTNIDLIVDDLDGLAAACAGLAEAHAWTVMAGRTLMQQAVPTTFGAVAAGWLVGTLEARRALLEQRARLAVQLGGAAGTIAPLGDDGVTVLGLLAEELGLCEPTVPWHAERSRIVLLGAALSAAAGAAAKIAMDVVLMAQTEVGEVAEPAGEERGRSSTMPHKHNPVGSVLALACAQRVAALTSSLGSRPHEHQRAVGAWQAEWETIHDALGLAGGAVWHARCALEGLEVNEDRLRSNLEMTGGMVLAEHVATLLRERIGRGEAHRVLREAAGRAASSRRPLRDELLSDRTVASELSEDEIDGALDPRAYLGSAPAFVDRALARYRAEVRPG